MFEKLLFAGETNAGKSQLAAALAAAERDQRALDIEILTGGTAPTDRLRAEVVSVLDEEGLEPSSDAPREITNEDMAGTDYVVTLGCSICDFKPAFWRGPADKWELEQPTITTVTDAREQRDELESRVEQLFTDLESMMQ